MIDNVLLLVLEEQEVNVSLVVSVNDNVVIKAHLLTGRLVYSVQRERYELDHPVFGQMYFTFRPSTIVNVTGNTISIEVNV